MAVMMASAIATLMYVLIVACPCPLWWDASAAAAWGSAMWILLRDEVDDREDRNPDDVDEVPVQTRDLHFRVVAPVDLSAQRQHHDDGQPHHAERHVGPVEAGQHEERRPEQIRPEGEPFVQGERGELVDLVEHEVQPEERGGPEPERR